MLTEKRALALWLGLFFYIMGATPFLPAETKISAGTGTLWVEDDGAAWYWHSGFNLGIDKNFSMGFNIGQAISTLPWMNGSVLGGMGELGFNTPRGGIQIRSGFFTHREFGIAIDNVRLSNEEGGGFFTGAEIPLYFGPFSVAPCFYYGKASWSEGDLYWFFGKPDIPSFMAFGLTLGLEKQYTRAGIFKHSLVFRQSLTDLKILSNEDEPLFNANFNGGVLSYSISLERRKTHFSAALGWLYAKSAIDGALSSANQPYFLFPFRFFNIDVSIDINAVVFLSGFRHSPGVFRYNIDFGLIHVFHGRGDVNTHYQMKKLFSGEETYDRIKLKISGLGAAFLLLEGSFPAIRIGRQRLSLSLQKAFILPWGYNKLLPSDTGGGNTGGGGTGGGGTGGGAQGQPHTPDILPLIRSALLSGLSFYGSLSW